MTVPNDQFGFDALLQEGNATNAARQFEQTTTHLPADMERAIPFHREQIKAHDVPCAPVTLMRPMPSEKRHMCWRVNSMGVISVYWHMKTHPAACLPKPAPQKREYVHSGGKMAHSQPRPQGCGCMSPRMGCLALAQPQCRIWDFLCGRFSSTNPFSAKQDIAAF